MFLCRRSDIMLQNHQIYISIKILFTCWTQEPMVNYRVSTITNNSSMTAQGKTNNKQQKQKNIN
jgi:hypothetical protein